VRLGGPVCSPDGPFMRISTGAEGLGRRRPEGGHRGRRAGGTVRWGRPGRSTCRSRIPWARRR